MKLTHLFVCRSETGLIPAAWLSATNVPVGNQRLIILVKFYKHCIVKNILQVFLFRGSLGNAIHSADAKCSYIT